METYTLEKTGLELSGGRLLKRDKTGAVQATFEVRKIDRAFVVTKWDGAGVTITVGFLCLAWVFFRFVPDGLWRWVAVVVSGAAFLLCTLGAKSRNIVIEIGEDTIEYPGLEIPDQIASFVAMINQARDAGEEIPEEKQAA